MKPRSESPLRARLVRIVLLAFPILLAFALTAGSVTGLLAWWTGQGWFVPANLTTGIVCGLIVWLFLACVHVRRDTLQIGYKDRLRFVGHLREQLTDLGYDVKQPDADHLVARPSFTALLLGGGLNVALAPGVATLSGPRLFVDMLRYRLRMFSMVAKAQHDLVERRQKHHSDRFLRRVSLTLQVRIADLPAVHKQLSAILEREEAQVQCELQMLIQKDHGIPERVIELEVRDWLRRRGIGFDLQKDMIQWQERRKMESACSSSRETPVYPESEPAAV